MKYFLWGFGASAVLAAIEYILIVVVTVVAITLALLWIAGGARALVVGVSAIPKYAKAKKASNQLELIRLDTEIWCLATAPIYLAGGYALVKYMVTLI